MVIPLIDRVLVSRENEDGEMEDEIVGTVIMDKKYGLVDEVGDPKTVKFMGYGDPAWLNAKGKNLQHWEDQLKGWGRTWEQRTTPVVVPAAIEQMFDEPDFEDETEKAPTPPRRRKGR